jgi:hypothetical protein
VSPFDEVSEHVVKSDFIVDIGPGIRPQPFFVARRHLCIEPHHEYASWLRKNNYEVIQDTALAALPEIASCDTIFMLDVIEHMTRECGKEVVKIAQEKAKQIVIFTPEGFLKQEYIEGEKDAWGMDGTYWQTHRSGWTPEDFPGWIIKKVKTGVPMLFAIWNA